MHLEYCCIVKGMRKCVQRAKTLHSLCALFKEYDEKKTKRKIYVHEM